MKVHVDRTTWRGTKAPQTIADNNSQTDESRRLQRTPAASPGKPFEFLPHRIHQFKKCLFDTTKLWRMYYAALGNQNKGLLERELAGGVNTLLDISIPLSLDAKNKTLR